MTPAERRAWDDLQNALARTRFERDRLRALAADLARENRPMTAILNYSERARELLAVLYPREPR